MGSNPTLSANSICAEQGNSIASPFPTGERNLTPTAGGVGTRLVLSESKLLRIGSMTVFYLAQGLPIGLFLTAMAAWLASNGRSEGEVAAVVSLTYLPWSFKFIAAALMDRYTFLPMGRRRSWLITSQAVIVVGLLLAAYMSPTPADATLVAWLGFAIFCGSAIQDVAVDGLAVDILPEEEQGTASAFMFGGQALGIAGGAAIGGLLLEHYGATTTFLAFIPLNLGILLLAIILRERPGERILPWTNGEASPVSKATHGIGWFEILGITMRSMIKRDSILLLLASACGRICAGVFVAFWPFFATTEAGYSTSSYSALIGIMGLACSVACMGIGALMIQRLGPRLSSTITYIGYGVIALVFLVSPDIAKIGSAFVLLSILWNCTDVLTTVSSNPLRMRLSEKRVAATQFTIYNSLGNLPVPLGASLFAWAMGAGGLTTLMPIVIVLTIACGIAFSMMQIGGRPVTTAELEPVPRVD